MITKCDILNRDGYRLAAFLHLPQQPGERILILANSFKGHKDYLPVFPAFCEAAVTRGYAALRFDPFGTGESGGSFEESTISSQTNDLIDVVQWASRQGHTSIGLIGLSLGALICAGACAQTQRIQALALWSPAIDMRAEHETNRNSIVENGCAMVRRTLTGENLRLGRKMWEEFGTVTLSQWLPGIRCPALIITGGKDRSIDRSRLKECVRELPNRSGVSYHNIPGADHNFIYKHDQLIGKTLDWLDREMPEPVSQLRNPHIGA